MKRPSQLFTNFEDSKPETAHEKPLAARVEMVFHHQQFKYIGRNTSRDAAKTGPDISDKTTQQGNIKETLFFQELGPAFNVNVGSEKLMLY